MKKQLFMFAALLVAVAAKAQVSVDMGKFFTIPEGQKNMELNDPNKTIEGIVFIGDNRPAETVEDGKFKGMRVNKSRRYFTVGDKTVQYELALAFRRAAKGIMSKKVVDINAVPRSCMIELKPTSAGKLTFCAMTSREEGNTLYVAVRNGDTFKNLAALKYEKSDKTGRKDNPFEDIRSCDYQYNDGDEIWIYSDGGIALYGFEFSGSIDKAFAGSNPDDVYKAIRRANKNKK